MIRKLLLWLCVFALVLSSAAVSAAEIVLPNEAPGMRTVIYYVPSIKNDNDPEIKTASCAAQAILSRWNARLNPVWQKYNSTNPLQATGGRTIFTKGNDDGKSEINNRALPDNYENVPYDIWFIVHENAAANFMANEKLAAQFREKLLLNPDSRLHVVFITGTELTVPDSSPLGQLAAEGRADWSLLTADFRAENGVDTLHNASYFMANLYGRPVDLAVSQTEGTQEYTFDVPEDTNALVVIRWNGAAGQAVFTDGAGNQVPTDSQESAFERDYASYTGTMIGRVDAGARRVTINSSEALSVQAYWYPNLNDIQPGLDLGETHAWERGTNDLVLKVARLIGRPEQYTVFFKYWDKEADRENPKTIYPEGGFDEAKSCWKRPIDVTDESIQFVAVTPTVQLRTADGNLIWAWTGEEQKINVQSAGIQVNQNHPDEIIIYTDRENGKAGSITYNWKKQEFFLFNENEKWDIQAQVEDENAGIEVVPTAKGFTVTPKEGETPGGTVRLSGKVTDALGQEYTDECTVTFYVADVADLAGNIGVLFTGENDIFNAGDSLNVQASLSADLLEQWGEACRQLPDFPAAETLALSAALGNDAPEEGTPLTAEENGDLYASVDVAISTEQKAGETKLTAWIRTGDGSRELSKISWPLEVKNDSPVIFAGTERQKNPEGTDPSAEAETVALSENLQKYRKADEEKAETIKIRMEGAPLNFGFWIFHGYDRVENLLETMFGSDEPFFLFSDDLGNLSEVEISVDRSEGLELPDYFENKAGVWTYSVTNEEDHVIIPVLEPGEYTVTLKANDGASDSEAYVYKVQVYSSFLRIVSYAALGLAAFLLLLTLFLVIRQIRKPSFESIRVRCFVSSDEDQDNQRELLEKSNPVPMQNFAKKGVPLTTLLILSRQPALPAEYASVTEDIMVYPTKHKDLSLQFGKDAMKTIGRHEKKELLPLGGSFRMRIGSEYIMIENLQPNS